MQKPTIPFRWLRGPRPAAWLLPDHVADRRTRDRLPLPPAWMRSGLPWRTSRAGWGRRVTVDGSQLVGERAALAGLDRRGSTSVGGLARMVRAADGWMALNLARPSDVEALPALVAAPVDPGNWSEIAARIAALPVAELVETGDLLGLPLAAVTEARSPPPAHPWRVLSYGADISPREKPLVVDLTGLWAGPLAGSLIGAAGARVVKVESRSRPDGARFGPPGFFDLLNAAKEMVVFDPDDPVELQRLRRLLGAADLVLGGIATEGDGPVESRPRGAGCRWHIMDLDHGSWPLRPGLEPGGVRRRRGRCRRPGDRRFPAPVRGRCDR